MVSAVDRLPPHNIEAEQSVLGSILLDRDAIIGVATSLKSDDFYHPANGTVYQAIRDLYERREPTDILTLSDELTRRGQIDQVGGLAYLASLMDVVPTAVHVEYYAKIVERTATMRRLIDAGAFIVGLGFREDLEVQEALDSAERRVFDVAQRRSTTEFVQIQTVLEELFDRLDAIQHDRGSLVGVPTGFLDLDRLTGGLQRSDLIIVAARPSFGKSSLALGLAHTAAVLHNRTVGIFSLEMQAEQVVQRILSIETSVDIHKLRTGSISDREWGALSRALGRVGESPIFIDDSPTLSVMDIKSKSRRLQAEHGLDLIVVDYLQLMTGQRSENRVQQIAEISRGLKSLARELNVPVIALSQLSRAIENRPNHRPMLSDLRESGSIEQDADIVLFIHREDKFNPEYEKKNVAELILAKHRNGPTASFEVHFFDKTARFSSMETIKDPGLS
ncbi:MAG: replicative DNA helicase [Thermomicrobiales bacterium]|nr:replicative DNA helicase [Thermomicrobiales bacterium]